MIYVRSESYWRQKIDQDLPWFLRGHFFKRPNQENKFCIMSLICRKLFTGRESISTVWCNTIGTVFNLMSSFQELEQYRPPWNLWLQVILCTATVQSNTSRFNQKKNTTTKIQENFKNYQKIILYFHIEHIMNIFLLKEWRIAYIYFYFYVHRCVRCSFCVFCSVQ